MHRTGMILRVLCMAWLCSSAVSWADNDLRCATLAGVWAGDTMVSTAQWLAAGREGPAHCLVRGVIEPRIGSGGKQYGTGFELRLPLDWNGRFLFQGGGGMDGTVNPALGVIDPTQPMDTALSRGMAVASTDAGHYGDSPNDPWWAADEQARHDNGYRSVRLVTERSRAMMQRHYGELPHHSYFMGCSNGGRQGMVAATRYPQFFDGVLAGAPAFDLAGSVVAWNWNTRVLQQLADLEHGGDLSATFSDAQLVGVSQAATAACDGDDGALDQLVFRPLHCTFDPAVLQCGAQEAATPACLSAAQVAALKKIQQGPQAVDGSTVYAGWQLAGIDGPTGFRLWVLGRYPGAEPSSLGGLFQRDWLRYIGHTPPLPDYDWRTFSVAQRALLDATAPLWDATSTAYAPFAGRGGKLIVWHGTADGAFSTAHLVDWFATLQRDNHGAAATAAFARLYLVPGMHHCAGGQGLQSFDALSPLIDWVERGTAPQAIAAQGVAAGSSAPLRRPLCPFPSYAAPTAAGQFGCLAPPDKP